MGRGSLDVPRQRLRLMNYHESSVAEQHGVKIVRCEIQLNLQMCRM